MYVRTYVLMYICTYVCMAACTFTYILNKYVCTYVCTRTNMHCFLRSDPTGDRKYVCTYVRLMCRCRGDIVVAHDTITQAY